MISDHFDRICIINMPRSLKRRAAVLFQIGTMQFKNAGLVEAVDGSSLDLEKMKAEGSLKWNDWNQRDLTHGEVGCYLSHVKIWNMLVNQGLERVLICEDDIIWRPDANDIADRFMAEVPDDWDILHFHSYTGVGSGQQNDIGRKRLGTHVWRGCNEGGGTVCYAITARGARFLLGRAFPVSYAVDGVTNKLTSPKRSAEYHGYVCEPFLCELSNGPSEIDMIDHRQGKSC
jgi:glycosyl transferase family 25